jgi:hypothetical protein
MKTKEQIEEQLGKVRAARNLAMYEGEKRIQEKWNDDIKLLEWVLD